MTLYDTIHSANPILRSFVSGAEMQIDWDLRFNLRTCGIRESCLLLVRCRFPPLLRRVASQLKVSTERWNDYAHRDETRREHLAELQAIFGFKLFTQRHYRQAVL
jgi:hypothetical protein